MKEKEKNILLLFYEYGIFAAFVSSLLITWLNVFYGFLFIVLIFVITPLIMFFLEGDTSDDISHKASGGNKLSSRMPVISNKIRHAELKYFSPKNTATDQVLLSLIKTIDWALFEGLCLDYIKSQGYSGNKTVHGADGGVDIEFSNGKIKGIVQCKRYNKNIGVSLIREFLGVMTTQNIDKAVFITSSDFTEEAKAFAAPLNNFHLISGKQLVDRINKLPNERSQIMLGKLTSVDYLIPTCAQCNIKMIQREAKKSGRLFWGCKNYPRCHSKINIHQS